MAGKKSLGCDTDDVELIPASDERPTVDERSRTHRVDFCIEWSGDAAPGPAHLRG